MEYQVKEKKVLAASLKEISHEYLWMTNLSTNQKIENERHFFEWSRNKNREVHARNGIIMQHPTIPKMQI